MEKKSITELKAIAENFDRYFTKIGSNLEKDIGTSNGSFNKYIKKHATNQPEKVISINEF